MPVMNVILEGDRAWPDVANLAEQGKLIHLRDAPWSLAALAMGMSSGRTSVALRIDLPDGRTLIAETSLGLLLGAARAFEARHGDQAEAPGEGE